VTSFITVATQFARMSTLTQLSMGSVVHWSLPGPRVSVNRIKEAEQRTSRTLAPGKGLRWDDCCFLAFLQELLPAMHFGKNAIDCFAR
jgi:hypothetical protein